MGDKMARALGAKGGLTVTIAGKECSVRPLGMRELTEVEVDCLERYKRQYLKTVSANLDLLPERDRAGIMDRKLDEAARWDVDSLPSRFAHDPDRVKVSRGLRRWLTEKLGMDGKAGDEQVKRLAATALDQESLSAKGYEGLTKTGPPPRLKVPYVNWWITGCFDGMITFIWVCFRRDGVTREQVVNELGGDLGKLAEVSREIERLSVPSAGNG